MKEFRYIITDALGIHARPAGLLVKLSSTFESNITIKKEEKEVDAKRVIGLMGLGVKKGAEIIVKADGVDELAAIVALEEFFKENL